MTEIGTSFEHSTPELYDLYMGPLLFEPYAKVVAERAALLNRTVFSRSPQAPAS